MRVLAITSLLLACASAERIALDGSIESRNSQRAVEVVAADFGRNLGDSIESQKSESTVQVVAADLMRDLVSTPQSTAIQTSASAADLVAAGAAALTIIPRWHGSVAAIQEVLAAAVAGRLWNGEINSQFESVQAIVGENELEGLLDGSVEYEQLRSLRSGSAVLQAAEELIEATDQATLLSEMFGGLTDTMVSATGLAEGVAELDDVWARVDLGLVRSLEQRAGDLHETFQAESTRVTAGRTFLMPFLEDWDSLGSWTRARRVYSNSDDMTSGFELIAQSYLALQPAFGDLQQLMADTADAAQSLVDASRTVGYFADRGVGADESIRRILCHDRNVRTFSLDAEVDLRTMTCMRYSMLRIQRCQCANADDCYVSSQYRPSPSTTKRCFKPQ